MRQKPTSTAVLLLNHAGGFAGIRPRANLEIRTDKGRADQQHQAKRSRHRRTNTRATGQTWKIRTGKDRANQQLRAKENRPRRIDVTEPGGVRVDSSRLSATALAVSFDAFRRIRYPSLSASSCNPNHLGPTESWMAPRSNCFLASH